MSFETIKTFLPLKDWNSPLFKVIRYEGLTKLILNIEATVD